MTSTLLTRGNGPSDAIVRVFTADTSPIYTVPFTSITFKQIGHIIFFFSFLEPDDRDGDTVGGDHGAGLAQQEGAQVILTYHTQICPSRIQSDRSSVHCGISLEPLSERPFNN